MGIIACAGELGIALVAITRGSKSPLAMPLVVLSLVMFSWNFCSLAWETSQVVTWNLLDKSTSPLTVPLVLHFALAFIGRKRKYLWVLWATYGYFSALALTGVLAFFGGWPSRFAGTAAWSTWFIGGAVPIATFGLWVVVQHLRRTPNTEEQDRTRLFLIAIIAMIVIGFTELAADLKFAVPRLGHLSTLVFNSLIAVIAFRLKIFDRELSSNLFFFAAVLAGLATLTFFLVFSLLGTNTAALVVGTATITLAMLAATRQVLETRAARRERLERYATLGRFSAQMAHDLKNPLAALKGAAQFLREEVARGRPLQEQGEFLELIGDQVERLTRGVDDYQRLGRMEPVRLPVDVNEAARGVLALQSFAASPQIQVHSALAPSLPTCLVDRDLLGKALENLIRNAIEAMPQGGSITLRTATESNEVVVSVEDTGPGMDARTQERAFDAFYTTKATGSGLGLAFVRRVAEAHDGQVFLVSREGEGTSIRIHLPAAADNPGWSR